MGAIAEGFAAFAQPLIDETDGSREQLNHALTMAQLCYNLALLPEDSREKMLREFRQSLEMDDEEFEAFRLSVIVPMIRRHEEMFPRMDRRSSPGLRPPMGVLQSGPTPRAIPTTVVSTEKRPVIDRYAPCPCNSGKKYKFCCGKKSR